MRIARPGLPGWMRLVVRIMTGSAGLVLLLGARGESLLLGTRSSFGCMWWPVHRVERRGISIDASKLQRRCRASRGRPPWGRLVVTLVGDAAGSASSLNRLTGRAVAGAVTPVCGSTSTLRSCAAGARRRRRRREPGYQPASASTAPCTPNRRTASAIARIDCCSCASTVLVISSARGGRYSSAVRRSNARSASGRHRLGFDRAEDVGPPFLAALARLRRQLGCLFGGDRQAVFRDVEVGQVSPQFIEDLLVDQDADRVPVADVEDAHRPAVGESADVLGGVVGQRQRREASGRRRAAPPVPRSRRG